MSVPTVVVRRKPLIISVLEGEPAGPDGPHRDLGSLLLGSAVQQNSRLGEAFKGCF